VSKELVVSANRHETRVALLDDDKLVELSIERITEHALAGSVYKGRVSRVLPGMQSAFVKVGLERDAFLYVSDVIDETADLEEGVLDEPEDSLVIDGAAADPEPVRKPRKVEEAPEPERPVVRERRGRRPRRRRRDRKDDTLLPESKFAAVDDVPRKAVKPALVPDEVAPADDEDDDFGLTPLPGESLAKYRRPAADPELDADADLDTEVELDEDEHQPLATGVSRFDDPSDDDEDDEEEEPDESADAVAADDDEDEDEDDNSEDDEDQDPGDEDAEGDDETDSPEVAAEEEDDERAVADYEPENPDQELEVEPYDDEPSDSDDPTGLPRKSLFEPGVDLDEVEEKVVAAPPAREATQEAAVLDPREDRQLRRGRRGRRRGRRRGGRGEQDREQDRVVEPLEAKAERPHEQPGEPEAITEPGEPDEAPEHEERAEKSQRGDRPERTEKSERSGRSGRHERGAGNESEVRISDLLKPGQELIVQIAKEPLGKKGARITTHIALPGRHLVYMPNSPHVGVSRKIGSDAERARLRKVIKANMEGIPGGFIVRTAGAGASDEDLADDMRFLANLWSTIQEKAERMPAPALLHQDLDVVERILRDQLGQNFKSIWVDSEEHYESILRFVERFQPDLVGKVKLYTRSKPIFDEFNVTPEIEKALRPKVWLKSGGYIVINQTEALVAIDINTGKYVGKSDRLEDTITKTNLEAVEEIVRQMRLRDLGGIIVVDFIDMDDKTNRKKVLQALEKELRRDRAPSKALQFNDFGLVAITRKRVKQSLERSLCSPCPACEGSGLVKSTTSVILDILEQARRLAPKVKGKKDLILRVNPDVARALKSRDNTFLQELEEALGAHVLVRSDVSLHRENFDVT
jgi:Rne/Rng family ribonuclease